LLKIGYSLEQILEALRSRGLELSVETARTYLKTLRKGKGRR
jgi:hypothetical protein